MHGSRHPAARFAQPLLERAEAREDDFAFFVEEATSVRRLDAGVAGPFHQTAIEALLEAAHLLAHRRLGNEVELGRAGEAARFDQVTEGFQGLELNKIILS